MQSTIVHTTDTATVREQERRHRHHRQAVLVMAWAADNARSHGPAPTYGLCLRCGGLEVRLTTVTGTRDYSSIGESSRYPTGHGCELCD